MHIFRPLETFRKLILCLSLYYSGLTHHAVYVVIKVILEVPDLKVIEENLDLQDLKAKEENPDKEENQVQQAHLVPEAKEESKVLRDNPDQLDLQDQLASEENLVLMDHLDREENLGKQVEMVNPDRKDLRVSITLYFKIFTECWYKADGC